MKGSHTCKIKSALLTSPDEELVDVFKPIQYRNVKGILILTDKQVIFAEEKGIISKSYKPVFSVKLLDLEEIQQLSATDTQTIKLGDFEVSSSKVEGLLNFYNNYILPMVQMAKGPVQVEYKPRWMTPEEVEKEMLDRGLVKHKGQWVTPEEKFEEEQKAKGLVKFMGRWGTPKQVDKWKKLYTGLTCDFMDRSPKEFEEFIAELFTKMGYSTSTTPLSADYGADVIAKKESETIAVQIKRYKPGNKVGVKDLNQVLGSMYRYNADKAIMITTSDFTLAARKLARTAPVELWNRAKLYEMIDKHYFGDSGSSIVANILQREREAMKWVLKANRLSDLGKYENAIEAYEWFLELAEDFKKFEAVRKETLNNIGFCLSKLGKFKKAIEWFDKVLEIDPEFQVAKDNKALAQKELGKPLVPLKQKETKHIVTKAYLRAPNLAHNLNLSVKGRYLEITLLHLAENQEFECPNSCYYFEKQYKPDIYDCPKGLFVSQRPVPMEKMFSTTILVKVKNISSRILHIDFKRFHIFDSRGNQYDLPIMHKALCDELSRKLPPQYKTSSFNLYNDAQAICLLCFSQVPSKAKITRLVYRQQIVDPGPVGGLVKDTETFDIRIVSHEKVENTN